MDDLAMKRQWHRLENKSSQEPLDLFMVYSKVSLKRARMKKKFRKDYSRYLSEKMVREFWGYCMVQPILRSNFFGLDLVAIEPMSDLPKGELIYTEYKTK
jgi:hypothetical protein